MEESRPTPRAEGLLSAVKPPGQTKWAQTESVGIKPSQPYAHHGEAAGQQHRKKVSFSLSPPQSLCILSGTFGHIQGTVLPHCR